VSADTEALLATVREEQRRSDPARRGGLEFALTVFAPALASLAAELERLRRYEDEAWTLVPRDEWERVKAERDALQTKLRIEHEHYGDPEALAGSAFYLRLERDKALSALREIAGNHNRCDAGHVKIARRAIAEIEGEGR